jgi:hypothetical protein
MAVALVRLLVLAVGDMMVSKFTDMAASRKGTTKVIMVMAIATVLRIGVTSDLVLTIITDSSGIGISITTFGGRVVLTITITDISVGLMSMRIPREQILVRVQRRLVWRPRLRMELLLW